MVHAGRRRDDSLSIHDRRSEDVDETVDRRSSHGEGPDSRSVVRTRLPRGQLLDREYAEGRAGGREEKGLELITGSALGLERTTCERNWSSWLRARACCWPPRRRARIMRSPRNSTSTSR